MVVNFYFFIDRKMVLQHAKFVFLFTTCISASLFLLNLSYYKIPQPKQQQQQQQQQAPFDAFLQAHPIYSKFNFTARTKEKKKKINVLVIVSSAPKRSDRRQMIRETWWQECRNTGKVCKNQ